MLIFRENLCKYIMLYFYLAGLGITLTWLLIWFYSPLKTTLGQIFFSKSIISNDQFETALMITNPILGKLLGCYICTSFWGSFIVGTLLTLSFNLPLYFPVLAWFTYPCLAYIYKLLVDKIH